MRFVCGFVCVKPCNVEKVRRLANSHCGTRWRALRSDLSGETARPCAQQVLGNLAGGQIPKSYRKNLDDELAMSGSILEPCDGGLAALCWSEWKKAHAR